MLATADFRELVKNGLLLAVDLILTDAEGRVLMGKRQNAPARGFWFVPGGRIFKNETLAQAIQRVSSTELSVAIAPAAVTVRGLFLHHYPDNVFGDPGFDTCYWVIACQAALPEEGFRPDSQHEDLRLWDPQSLLADPTVHRYTKNYFVADPDNLFFACQAPVEPVGLTGERPVRGS
jgi:colanic acid biosynthesis protein WcaH